MKCCVCNWIPENWGNLACQSDLKDHAAGSDAAEMALKKTTVSIQEKRDEPAFLSLFLLDIQPPLLFFLPSFLFLSFSSLLHFSSNKEESYLTEYRDTETGVQ